MSGFQNVLALDTALAGCSAVVVAGEKAVVQGQAMACGQAEHLVPFVQEAMAESGLSYDALDALICTVGPGAFTGLRIGLAAAKGYEISLGIPLYGVTTLQALALNYQKRGEGEACSVILETKRSDFYVQHFDRNGQAVSAAQAVEAEGVLAGRPPGSVLIGDGAERFLSEVACDAVYAGGYELPDMVDVCRVLQERGADAGIFVKPEPVYLRGADVSQPKTPPRILSNI